jgi:hypothetical protein
VIRGSSSRLGASAILQLTEKLASGHDVVITPDGPRGPVYELGPGIVFLAQKSDASVLPMNLEYSRYWRLGAGIASSSRNHFPKCACWSANRFASSRRVHPTNSRPNAARAGRDDVAVEMR